MKMHSQLAEVGVTLDELDRIVAISSARSSPESAAEIDLSKLTPANVGQALQDTALARLVRREVLVVNREVSALLDRRARQIINQNHDLIVETIRPAFDESVRELGESISLLGPDPNLKALVVIPGAGAASDRRKATIKRLDALRHVRVMCSSSKQDASWYLSDDGEMTVQELDRAQSAYSGFGHFAELLLVAGYTLRLNSDTEAQALRHAAAARTADTARTAENARREARENDPQRKRYIEAWERMGARKS